MQPEKVSPKDLPLASAAHPEIALFFAQLDQATAEWQDWLDEKTVTAEQIVWQPFPGGHSIGALMLYIAEVEAYWLHEVAAGVPLSEEDMQTFLSAETDAFTGKWPIPPRQPLAWYGAQLDAVRAKTKALLADTAPDATGTRTDDGHMFTLRWLFTHVIAHEAYHGGQAVLIALMQASVASR